MLFASAPTNVTSAVAEPDFAINDGAISSFAFSYGTKRFVLGLGADVGGNCGIAESADGGATWAIKDPSYPGLVSTFGMVGSANGSTIYVAIQVATATLRVLTFDMVTGVYTSTSPDLVATDPVDNGFGIANSIGDYYYFSRQTDSTLGSQVPMMYILSAGSWSSGVRLSANDGFFNLFNACACVDSNDDIHVYWMTDGLPFDLAYTKISGSSFPPSTIVKSGNTSVFRAVCFGGKQYISWSANSLSEQWVIVGDSDTNPTSWSDTQIDIANIGGASAQARNAAFVPDGTTLNLFYSAIAFGASPHVQQIWHSRLVSGLWSTPALAYDAQANPPSAQAFATQLISGIDVCLTGTAAYACAMNAINATGGLNVYFMSAGAAARRSYAF